VAVAVLLAAAVAVQVVLRLVVAPGAVQVLVVQVVQGT
jgi:hypothetical protein